MNWTSNSITDKDDDGCQDSTEDGDDDQDGWGDYNDDCSNVAEPTATEGDGTFTYDLGSNLSDNTGDAGDAIFYEFTGDPNYTTSGLPPDLGNWNITPNYAIIEGQPAIQFEGFNGLELPLSATNGVDTSNEIKYEFQFYLNDSYNEDDDEHPTANYSSSDFQGSTVEELSLIHI